MSDLTQKELIRAVQDGLQIEADFLTTPPGPIAQILHRAKVDAAEALAGLVSVDPTDSKAIQELQNEIHLYRSLLRHCTGIMNDAREAAHKLDAEDVEDLAKTIGLTETNDA